MTCRERKRAEQNELHSAVEMLTAQLAAMKALEVRAADLEAQNLALAQQASASQHQAQMLQQQVIFCDWYKGGGIVQLSPL